jgi:hypothetical protein
MHPGPGFRDLHEFMSALDLQEALDLIAKHDDIV